MASVSRYLGINLARMDDTVGLISDGLRTAAHPADIAPIKGSIANTARGMELNTKRVVKPIETFFFDFCLRL
jgi:hypothetical protein